MTQPEDARNATRAALNRIPESMAASRTAMEFLVANTSKGAAPLNDQTLKLFAMVAVCIFQLDNKIEELEGRPGVPLEQLSAIFREFGIGT